MKSIKGTVNWGIIGCGNVCEVKSGPAFNKIENSRLVGVLFPKYRVEDIFTIWPRTNSISCVGYLEDLLNQKDSQ